MSEQQQTKEPLWRRVISFTSFRLIPAILIIAIAWSLLRVVGAFWGNYSEYNTIATRQDDYQATATAIAPDAASQSYQDDNIVLAGWQFVTNTPIPSPTLDITSTPVPPTIDPLTLNTPVPSPTFYLPGDRAVEQAAGTAVPTRAPVVPRDYDLVNILLLGGDDELDSGGTSRTDTMIVVSINRDTGTVSMLSFPRDIFVYLPTQPYMGRLNTVYDIGEIIQYSGGGFGLMREVIFYNFGIQLHYYAQVNFTDFKTIIDTLGGVNMVVDCAYQDYLLIDTEIPSGAVIANEEDLLYTLPVGYYEFSGAEALWYVRTRNLTDDFDRGRRQQQLLRSIFRAARDNGQLQNVASLWNDLKAVVETDVPLDLVVRLLPIALDLDINDIQTFTMTRTYHTQPWQPSSGPYAGSFVQLPIYDPIRQLMTDFYQPPTSSQLDVSGPSIAVYNGTNNPNWDIVASERLREAGLNAYAAGEAGEILNDTTLVDRVADDKGSPVPLILQELNIGTSNLSIQPDPARTIDYEVVVGENYNSCPVTNVLPVEE